MPTSEPRCSVYILWCFIINSYKIKCSTDLEELNFTNICKLIKTTLAINGITTEEAEYRETALKIEKVEINKQQRRKRHTKIH